MLDGTLKSGYQFSKLALYLITLGKRVSAICGIAKVDGMAVCTAVLRLAYGIMKNGLRILGIDLDRT